MVQTREHLEKEETLLRTKRRTLEKRARVARLRKARREMRKKQGKDDDTDDEGADVPSGFGDYDKEKLRKVQRELAKERKGETLKRMAVKNINTKGERRMSTNQEEQLAQLYYGKNGKALKQWNVAKNANDKKDMPTPFGRDALFHLMKSKSNDFPSRRAIGEWLGEQKLQQVFAQRDTEDGDVAPFTPTKPFQSLSIDLTVYKFRDSTKRKDTDDWGASGYILVVIDNFSRYMYANYIDQKWSKGAKTPGPVLTQLKKIIEEVKRNPANKRPNKLPNFIQMDDGAEFKGVLEEWVEGEGIRIVRTVGGEPQSNGLVERANGKLKKIISKFYVIKGKAWRSILPYATNAYNDQLNRSIGMTPREALLLTDAQEGKLKEKVKDTQVKEGTAVSAVDLFEVGDKVRLRIAPSEFNKGTEQSYYSKVFTIKSVKDNWMDDTKAARYKIERLDKRGGDDGNKLLTQKWWGRKNLRRVKGKVLGKERLNKNKQLKTGTRITKALRPLLYKTKQDNETVDSIARYMNDKFGGSLRWGEVADINGFGANNAQPGKNQRLRQGTEVNIPPPR
jgi:hypothetical protein